MSDATPTNGREPLSKERILEAALARIDEGGLEALSMRRLGADLGVEAMSLYNYFQSKDEMLDGVVEMMAREIRVSAEPRLAWQERLTETARSFRAVATAHPNAFPLFVARPVGAYLSARAIYEGIVSTLIEAGFDETTAVQSFRALARYIVGFAMAEAAGPGSGLAMPSGIEADGPLIARVLREVAESSPDDLFEFGLDLLVRGLEVRLAAPGSATSDPAGRGSARSAS